MKIINASVVALGIVMASIPVHAEYAAGDEIAVLQGFKAGGGSDALAQLTQPFLTKLLGVDMVNQYIPGAAGAIAWTRLAKQSKNDGATISITNTPMLVTNYIMNDAITYSIDELTPIANVVTDPGIIVVPGDSPFKTVEDLFAAAKKTPGRITVGNSGVGGDDFFSAILVEKAAGVKFQSVPFQGDGPSATAAMGGKIDASFNNLGNVYGFVKSGDLRALAIFTKERVDFLPDVPTLMEKGMNVVAGSSRGYSAPAGIPEKAREQLIAAFESLKVNEEFKAIAKERALVLDIITGDNYLQMMRSMETDYKKIWSEIKSEVSK
ncbi:MAG: tripartite-type tricarboxylate transporter receptor subunit TctC [Candidatus Azotimanducaceae bacterium]|jgi:tripartite-type tricarboxylate transporter receptor subunit TctC